MFCFINFVVNINAVNRSEKLNMIFLKSEKKVLELEKTPDLPYEFKGL